MMETINVHQYVCMHKFIDLLNKNTTVKSPTDDKDEATRQLHRVTPRLKRHNRYSRLVDKPLSIVSSSCTLQFGLALLDGSAGCVERFQRGYDASHGDVAVL